MVLSRIWSAFIIVAIIVASIKYLFSDSYKAIYNDMVVGKSGDTVQIATQNLSELNPEIKSALLLKPDFEQNRIHYKTDSATSQVAVYRVQATDGVIGTSETAVKICLGLIGIMTLFMGFMSIAEKAGGINLLSRMIQPFFSKLFPEIPKNHPSFGHMLLNFSANLLGLDNAATPFGLKAMESLQTLNPDKDNASNSQIMFLYGFPNADRYFSAVYDCYFCSNTGCHDCSFTLSKDQLAATRRHRLCWWYFCDYWFASGLSR